MPRQRSPRLCFLSLPPPLLYNWTAAACLNAVQARPVPPPPANPRPAAVHLRGSGGIEATALCMGMRVTSGRRRRRRSCSRSPVDADGIVDGDAVGGDAFVDGDGDGVDGDADGVLMLMVLLMLMLLLVVMLLLMVVVMVC